MLITMIPNVERARNAAILRRAYSDLAIYVKVPQLGRNMFEAYVMNSKRILPNGTSLCANVRDSWAYFCHGLDTSPSGNCSYQSGDFTACFQKIIDDGWKIKYRY